ncbi:MAG TPA: alpha/beta fold hydrolase [Anaeromyxobacteraceae bacterium]|jgi:haloalkane dehalogenase|nr:alpha/beta fold hydrolase [Anaeromyxobacteraceae bacterium]
MDGAIAADGSRPTWLPKSLFPFESRFLEVAGCRIHYVDEGHGPPLLLLHGNPTWSFLYREIVRRLSPRFRCVAPDYPGFGLSTAPAGYDFRPASHSRVLEELVDALGLSGWTVMVQDWGGPIGLGLAGRRPELFRALVIGNSWAWPVEGVPRIERFSRFMGGPVGGFLIRRLNFFVNAFVPAGIQRHKPSRAVMDAYRGPFARSASREPVHVFPREILASRAYLAEVRRNLDRLRELPALLVWGDRDVAFRRAEREQFELLFPRHRTIVLRGAGHYIQEDAPEEIAAAIEEWWDGVVAPP